MNQWVTDISRRVGATALIIAVIAVIALMMHTLASALLRTFVNQPLEGTIEYVGNWYMPLIVLLALVVVQQKKKHIEARLLFDRAPKAVQAEFQLFSLLVTLLTAVGLAWYGYVEAVRSMEIGLTAGVVGVVIWPVIFAVPIGFLLYALQIVLDIGQLISARASGRAAAEASSVKDGVDQ